MARDWQKPARNGHKESTVSRATAPRVMIEEINKIQMDIRKR